MPVYEVPSYMKIRAKIASWIVPLNYVSELDGEYITELRNVSLVIKEKVKMYPKYQLMTMKKDMRGNPEAFKVFPSTEHYALIPLETLVEVASKNTVFGK